MKNIYAFCLFVLMLTSCSSPHYLHNNYKYSGLNSDQQYQISGSAGLDYRGINTYDVNTAIRLDSTFTLGSNLCFGKIRSNNFKNSTTNLIQENKTDARYVDIDLGFQPDFNVPELLFETHIGLGFAGINNRKYENQEKISFSNLNYTKFFTEFDLGYRSPDGRFEIVFPIQIAYVKFNKIDTYNDSSLVWLQEKPNFRVTEIANILRFGNEKFKINGTTGLIFKRIYNNNDVKGGFYTSLGITFYDLWIDKRKNPLTKNK